MRVETLGLAERHGRGTELAQLIGPAFEDRRPLHEVEYAQT